MCGIAGYFGKNRFDTKKIQKILGTMIRRGPDSNGFKEINKEREEFAIDHLHVFTFNSLYLLIKNCNFTPILIERIKENSNKFILIAFGNL